MAPQTFANYVGTTVTLSWTNANSTTAASSFVVQRDTASSFSSANLRTWSTVMNATSWFNDRDKQDMALNPYAFTYDSTRNPLLPAGATYYYRVGARQADGSVAYGTAITVATAAASYPTATPTGMSAVAVSDYQVNISWNAASGATAYKLEKSLDSTFATQNCQLALVTGTSYSDPTVTANSVWYYRVRAVGSGGDSNWATASATASSITAAPTRLTATTGDGTITLTIPHRWHIHLHRNDPRYRGGIGHQQGERQRGRLDLDHDKCKPRDHEYCCRRNATTYRFRLRPVRSAGDQSARPDMVDCQRWRSDRLYRLLFGPVKRWHDCCAGHERRYHRLGLYTLAATATKANGQSTTSLVHVTIAPVLTSVAVSPTSVSISAGATQQFTSVARDQFSDALTTQPAWTWSVTGPGSINSSGLYTPPYSTGSATVRAVGGGLSAAANVTFSGQAEWNSSADGPWSGSRNWKDTAAGATIAPPGLRGIAGDTVLFASASGGTATLDGVSPSVAGITFNSSACGYTIASGTGGTLRLANGGSDASIIVSSGSHTISSPVALDSSVQIALASDSTLIISGTISGTGTSLNLTNHGTLILNGANDYTGGTFVQDGTLVVANANSLNAGTDLTIGVGGTVELASGLGQAIELGSLSFLTCAGSTRIFFAYGEDCVCGPNWQRSECGFGDVARCPDERRRHARAVFRSR